MTTPTPIDEVVGSNIRKRRVALGLTQAQLGEKLPEPLSGQQISKYEAGEDALAAQRLVDMTHALRCRLVDLFEGVTEAARDLGVMSRGVVAMMHNYSNMPDSIQRALSELVRAMAIELGQHLKTTDRP